MGPNFGDGGKNRGAVSFVHPWRQQLSPWTMVPWKDVATPENSIIRRGGRINGIGYFLFIVRKECF